MATTRELTNIENRFMFRGKKYKFYAYCPGPSIEMINEDGERFTFGINAPIANEFILPPNGAAHRPRVYEWPL